MKKKLFTAIITLATITLTFCQPIPASETEKIFTDGSEITSIETTETGELYTFTDGTGYYHEENEIPELSNINGLYPLTGIVKPASLTRGQTLPSNSAKPFPIFTVS